MHLILVSVSVRQLELQLLEMYTDLSIRQRDLTVSESALGSGELFRLMFYIVPQPIRGVINARCGSNHQHEELRGPMYASCAGQLNHLWKKIQLQEH